MLWRWAHCPPTQRLLRRTFIELPPGSSPSAVLHDNTNNQWWLVTQRLGDSGLYMEVDPSEIAWYDIGNDLKAYHSLRPHCSYQNSFQGAGLIHTWNPSRDIVIHHWMSTSTETLIIRPAASPIYWRMSTESDGLRLYTLLTRQHPSRHASSEEDLTHETSLAAS